jgi:WD40 repeat protein/serine/threonine protein kinase
MPNDPRRVQNLFLRLVELPVGERAAALERECGDDVELRVRIEALLGAHDEPQSFVTMPNAGLPGSTSGGAEQEETGGELSLESDRGSVDSRPTASVDSWRNVPSGLEIAGRYKLLEKIGEGGMGEVWVAKQTAPVKRKVALKLIKTGMDSKAVLARFEQERQALAIMDHPNIARVLDAGITAAGQPFFVMELVNGLPLTKYCDEVRLTPKERLELFIPICQAIQHAHQKGIVHRDLKPANILITLIDAKPVPKVIDFGVAKATSGKLTDETLSTAFGAVVGTLEYMSPEQAGFSNDDIDTRADIYSLGVILYELLTGLRPIDAKRLKMAALAEMMRIIKEEEPSTPSTRLSTDEGLASLAASRQTDPRKLMSLLRGELDWVVMKCLEKSRERRYETANALSRDIQRYLHDEPVEARPPSAAYRMSKFLKRNKAMVVAASMVLAALIVGVALASIGFVRARAERDIAEKASVEARAQKNRADEQKQLALDNARQSELRLAESVISQADAWSLAGRFAEAHQSYSAAYDKLVAMKAPLTAGELGLWNSYHQTTFPLLSFNGPREGVFSIAIAPDGRTALLGSNGMLKLWDLATGRELRTFTGHVGRVCGVAIAADGRTALSGGSDGTLKLWNLATGEEIRSFGGGTSQVQCIAIAPDGNTALSGTFDNTLKLWDLANGKELLNFKGLAHPVASLAIAPDSRTALSGGFDGALRLWDLTNGNELHTFRGHVLPVNGVAIAPGGHVALSASRDNTLRLWDLSAWKQIREFTGGTGPVCMLPGGLFALSPSSTGTLKLWNFASGEELRTFTGHKNSVLGIAIAAGGRTAVSAGIDGTLKVWDVSGRQEPLTLVGQNYGVTGAAIAPDGRTALSVGADGTLKLWDLATEKMLRSFAMAAKAVTISPDGQTALVGRNNGTLELFDLSSGNELRTFTGDTGQVLCVAISPDGQSAVSGGNKTITLWNLSSGKAIRTFTGHAAWINSVAFSPDSRTALSGSDDTTLRLWDLSSGETIRTFTANSGGITSVAIASDGRTAISGSFDESWMVWDLSNGRHSPHFVGHTGAIRSVAIAPDGRTALTGSNDGTLKLSEFSKDLSVAKEIRTFTGHAAAVTSVAFAPDGRGVLSGSADMTLKFWDFSRGAAQRSFEPRVANAQAALQQNPSDAAALATLGEWYAFRGMDQWAVDFLVRARDGGAAVAPLTLARCYWNLGQPAEARREFQAALDQSKDPGEQRYLGWCIKATGENSRGRDHD